MALVDVTKSCLDSITQISEHVQDSILYLDGGCTECFQYLGAFPLLLEMGVRAVCSLENMSPLDSVVDWNSKLDPARHVTVITSRLLSDAHRYILRCLSSHQGVRRCSIFTAISEIAHSAYPDSPLGPDAFREYELLLIQDFEELVKTRETESKKKEERNSNENVALEDEGWSQFSEGDISSLEVGSSGRDPCNDSPTSNRKDVGQTLVVSVHHFPLILTPLSPRAFVLPSEGSIADAFLSSNHEDSLSQGLPPFSTGIPSDGDDVPAGAILTAHFLYHLAAKMDLKLEIFSLGVLSKAVGKILTDMSSLYDVGRRKKSAGLLLIDRTLDLLTPCCHGDSIVDRFFSSLPRRESVTMSSQIKGSQNQLRQQTSGLHRPVLNIKIPLRETVYDAEVENTELLKRIDAFMHGWNSGEIQNDSVDSIYQSSSVQNRDPSSLEFEELCGSFVSTESLRGTPYLEALLDRRVKDGAILVKKWLQEALRRENISVNIKIRPGFATKSELIPMIKALARSQPCFIRNKGLIQLAAATVLALDELPSSRWDASVSAEKILSASAGDTSQNLAAQICDLIYKSSLMGQGQKSGQKDASPTLLSFKDALLLTIVGYILAGENFPTSGPTGPFSWQEEHLMKEAIVETILENPSIAELKFLSSIREELEAKVNKGDSKEKKEADESQIDDFDDDQWGSWGDEDASSNRDQAYGDMQLKLELRDRVDSLFRFFHKLSSLKSLNAVVGEAYSNSIFAGDPSTGKGMLYKLMTKLLNKSDIQGMEYHSSTVGRLFKSGFGRFGLGQAKPSLADQNVIMVFVVGGINCLEVRQVHEAISEGGRPDIELILGGTTLLTPSDMLDILLGQSSCI